MRLAIVVSHPIQYYSPWFRYLARNGFEGLRVFYLCDGGVKESLDHGFGVKVKWDVPLLEGYDYEFVQNVARAPGSHHWRGLDNPALEARLAAYGPEVILGFGYNYLTYYRWLFSRRQRVPLLFRGDSHRLVREGGVKAVLRRWWVARVLRKFAGFLYVGQANREYFALHGVEERRLFFCPHAVDNERFFAEVERARGEAADWRASLGIEPGRRVVLFAGKFERKKCPRDLVAAFKKAQLRDATLLLVGSGEEEEALRHDAEGRRDIVFAPFQNQSLMPRTYAAGDVFVLPSRGSGETWGLAVNEAMCMGRPVIVSDHVGCAQDLVRTRENGVVFRAGDVEVLAGALREALADAGRLQAWGARSREIVREYDFAHAAAGLRRAVEFVKGGLS